MYDASIYFVTINDFFPCWIEYRRNICHIWSLIFSK